MVWRGEWGSRGAGERSEKQEGARLWDGCEREEEEGAAGHQSASLQVDHRPRTRRRQPRGVLAKSRPRD
eukprot:CAMPEP_0180290884 /NCGR_PEP_ID=MMETSP0988-20121125/15741_1 /TAXON_ID=697907 /ORGANISM="non described non described, Strain CCMP2293" /LENGTH=68 /DNA_ID=CAMNT_0022266501 /DNA_START=618 /DNA_END=821 /DNA_ORIENTATION=-